jgi:SAM-dependent methyltransferase
VVLVQCSPDPNAIVACLEMVLDGTLSLSAFPTSHLQDFDQVRALLAASPKDEDRRKAILKISRDLQVFDENHPKSHYQYHHPDAKQYGTSKSRPPKIKRRFWFVLEEMERTIQRIQPVQSEALATSTSLSPSLNVTALEEHLTTFEVPAEDGGRTSPSSTLINIPDVDAMSNKHQISRMDYMKLKKWPQVRWLLQKLQQVLEKNTHMKNGLVVRILDVGGGRGDLAVAMAQSFPNVHVTVVDVNETSLEAGKDFAERVMGTQQADHQTSWHCADFAHFATEQLQQSSDRHFDLVVAWHACGDLSDYALEFATKTHASFIICPCCYTKRYIDGFEAQWIGDYVAGKEFGSVTGLHCQEIANVDELSPPAPRPYTETLATDIVTVQRMAEINEQMEVSQRAMLLINSMRLISLSKQQANQPAKDDGAILDRDASNANPGRLHLSLEQYDAKHSSKNLVLVGTRK